MKSEPRSDEPSLSRGLAKKLILSLLVALVFVWILQAGALPVLPDSAALSRLSASHAFVAILTWTVMLLVRAVRWQLLIAPVQAVPTRAVVSVALVGFAATVLLPLRSGEVVRPLLIRREGVNAWAATGTVGAERVLDGLFISVLLLVSLILSPPQTDNTSGPTSLGIDTAFISGAAHAAALLFAVAFVALILFYRFQALPGRLLMATLGRFQPNAAALIASRVQLVASGIGFLARPRVALPFFVVTAIYWVLNAFGLWVLGLGVGLSTFSLLSACAVLGVLAIGVIPPGAPGLFGTFQFALYAGLALYFPRARLESEGAALVFVMYASQIILILLGGAAGFLYLMRRRPVELAKDLARSEPQG